MKPTNDKVRTDMDRDTDSERKDKKGFEGQTGQMTDRHGKPITTPADGKMKKGTDSHGELSKHHDSKPGSGHSNQE